MWCGIDIDQLINKPTPDMLDQTRYVVVLLMNPHTSSYYYFILLTLQKCRRDQRKVLSPSLLINYPELLHVIVPAAPP